MSITEIPMGLQIGLNYYDLTPPIIIVNSRNNCSCNKLSTAIVAVPVPMSYGYHVHVWNGEEDPSI